MISEIKIDSLQRRALLLIPAVFLLVGAFFAIRWCFASSIAEYAQEKELAQFAADLSSSDPHVKFALAAIREKEFLPDEMNRAREEYEQAAALAPHDFRFWLALGRMRERTGDAEGAEKAVRRALELAPHYAQVRWALGNILLRQGKTDEAFTELKNAAEINPDFTPHVVNAAFQAFGAANVQVITEKLGNSKAVRKTLMSFLAKDKRFEEALAIWNGFTEAEKKELKTEGEELLSLLIQEKHFRAAAQIYPQIYPDDGNKPALGQITNAGFEGDIDVSAGSANPFAWKIADGQEPQIGIDKSSKHSDAQSLAFIFKSVSGQDFRQVTQTVAVENNAAYKLEFFARSSGIKSGSTVRWEVWDVSDSKLLAMSPAVPSGESDWQKIAVEFTAGNQTEAVQLRLARVPCNLPPCSLVGKIWFDDFGLQQISRK